jgi:hypothetical protein
MPIMQCLDAMVGFICYEVSRSIPGADFSGFLAEANAAALLIAKRDTGEERLVDKVSERTKMSESRTPQEPNR